MARADFYLIPESTQEAVWRFGCRLLEKAYEQAEKTLVWVADLNAAREFDKLLWTFRDIGFIPHHLIEEPINPPAFIQIGYKETPKEPFKILLNLTDNIPNSLDSFDRILQIVPQNKTLQKNARKLYQHCKTAGRDIQTHDMRK